MLLLYVCMDNVKTDPVESNEDEVTLRYDSELNLVLCDNLGGWDGGRIGREGTFLCLWLIHVDLWQKPAQYCKAIILQLKINSFFFKLTSQRKLGHVRKYANYQE